MNAVPKHSLKPFQGGNSMQAKVRVLFFCLSNDCNSQMAEGWARARPSPQLEVWSAGPKPTGLDPLAIRVMAEVGIDIHHQKAKALGELPAQLFDLVITFNEAAHRLLPELPGNPRMLLLDIEDPRPRVGAAAQPFRLLHNYRLVRDEIREFVETLPEALAPVNRKYYWIQPEFLRPSSSTAVAPAARRPPAAV